VQYMNMDIKTWCQLWNRDQISPGCVGLRIGIFIWMSILELVHCDMALFFTIILLGILEGNVRIKSSSSPSLKSLLTWEQLSFSKAIENKCIKFASPFVDLSFLVDWGLGDFKKSREPLNELINGSFLFLNGILKRSKFLPYVVFEFMGASEDLKVESKFLTSVSLLILECLGSSFSAETTFLSLVKELVVISGVVDLGGRLGVKLILLRILFFCETKFIGVLFLSVEKSVSLLPGGLSSTS